jgi:hypothetical protein
MTLKTVEAGNCGGSSTGLGVEKACVEAAFDPQLTFPHIALQAQKIAARYGLVVVVERGFVLAIGSDDELEEVFDPPFGGVA